MLGAEPSSEGVDWSSWVPMMKKGASIETSVVTTRPGSGSSALASLFQGRLARIASSRTPSTAIMTVGGMAMLEPKQPHDSAPSMATAIRTPSNTRKRATTADQARRGLSRAARVIASSIPIASLNVRSRPKGDWRTTGGRSAGVPANSLKSAPAATHRTASRTTRGVRSLRWGVSMVVSV